MKKRRRAQIRVAQRAYRERKDGTIKRNEAAISKLKRERIRFELTIGNMTEAFVKLNKHALASGLISKQPEFGTLLQQTMNRFCELVVGADDDGESADDTVQPVATEHPRPPETAQTVTPSPQQPVASPGQQHQFSLQHGQPLLVPPDQQWPLPMQSLEAIPLNATPAPSFNLTPPPLAAFQETTFARRLERTACAYLLDMFVDPRTSPATLNARMPMGPFVSTPAARIAVKNAICLDQYPHALGNWNFPLAHVGGAGLHFAAPPPEVEPPPLRGWHDERNYGPVRPPPPGFAALGLTPGEWPAGVPECVGMGGGWYDTRDVEAYLHTRGLDLRASAAVAEMEIPGPAAALAYSVRRVTINVDRLVELLCSVAICIVRGSGFRPKAVDYVLDTVLQEAW